MGILPGNQCISCFNHQVVTFSSRFSSRFSHVSLDPFLARTLRGVLSESTSCTGTGWRDGTWITSGISSGKFENPLYTWIRTRYWILNAPKWLNVLNLVMQCDAMWWKYIAIAFSAPERKLGILRPAGSHLQVVSLQTSWPSQYTNRSFAMPAFIASWPSSVAKTGWLIWNPESVSRFQHVISRHHLQVDLEPLGFGWRQCPCVCATRIILQSTDPGVRFIALDGHAAELSAANSWTHLDMTLAQVLWASVSFACGVWFTRWLPARRPVCRCC